MTSPARLWQFHGVIVDLIYHVDALPVSGEEAIVRDFQISPGGGFNAMVSARRAGMEVSYAGAVGDGPFGDIVSRALAGEEIEIVQPRSPERDQGCCTVMIEPTGERSFVAAEGAEGHVADIDFDRSCPQAHDWSVVSGYSLYYEGSRDGFLRWLGSDVLIPGLVFDPSPIVSSISPDAVAAALQRALWVSANAAEAAILSGITDPEQAARHLSLDRPEGGGALVRCGAQGCIVAVDGETWAIPAHQVEAIDTNGAGDTHLGAFIASLARGMSPVTSAQYANVAAALSTTRFGPATAPNLATIERTLLLKRAG